MTSASPGILLAVRIVRDARSLSSTGRAPSEGSNGDGSTVGLSRLRILVTALAMTGVAKLERRNPEALLELEKETLRQRLMDYDNGLAAHAGMTERLMTQLRSVEARERGMVALVAARLSAGEREAAARAALELKEHRAELEERRQQLADAETTYRSLLRAERQPSPMRRRASRKRANKFKACGSSRAAAEIISMSSSVVLDPTGAMFERLHEMIEEERIKARGRIRVRALSPRFRRRGSARGRATPPQRRGLAGIPFPSVGARKLCLAELFRGYRCK